MALMREGLWQIDTGEEALATIILAVDLSLLYLIGKPENPIVIWKKLANQYVKKGWATRLDLHLNFTHIETEGR